jgi:hypothetical protein
LDKKREGHPRICKKYTKDEIKKYCKLIPKVHYIGDRNLKEQFKQLKINGIWCPYIVSTFGRVFSVNYHNIPGCVKEMTKRYDKDNYCIVYLTINGVPYYGKIHRLVAFMFIKNPDKKHKTQVNHIDCDKHNNMVSNLEWVTDTENHNHAIEHGLINQACAEDVWSSIYTNDQIKQVCEMLENNRPIKEIMKKVGVTNYLIHDVLRRKKWKSVSKDYDFSKYHFGKDVDTITKICELLQEGQYTQTQIANLTNTNVKFVHCILTRHGHVDISKDYNFSKYNKKNK